MQKTPDHVIERKRDALAQFLGVDPGSITESSGVLYSFKAFFHGNDEAYLVLTDLEATVAAEFAVQDKLWLISLECVFSYFDIDAYPTDIIGKLKTRDIRQVNEGIKSLIYNSCGIDIMRKKMLAFGNRKNLLADYDQAENFQNGFFIYRLY